MHTICESKSLIKAIRKIPIHVLKHYEIWKQIIELEGPHGLRLIKGFHDEALKDRGKGIVLLVLQKDGELFIKWKIKIAKFMLSM